VLLGWRDVPVDRDMPMSPTVRDMEPVIRQIFIGRGADVMVPDALERKLYVIRKPLGQRHPGAQAQARQEFYVPSMSARTVVYKGLLLADQVGEYYPDLQDKRAVSALALVHQRFSTNTFPTWDWPTRSADRPQRRDQHPARQRQLDARARGRVLLAAARRGPAEALAADLRRPVRLGLLRQRARAAGDGRLPLAHAMMMMIPEAWERHTR
jgi:glutamate synthase (NADPH/NADH) large chain